ncbi:unnamed protein product [Miscanthus lutarioriparius]|uniref:DUF659 domain-containing protein n=1 Tax=Miscanthus lutarioriparius TaxID=422564 RepID=A0A811NS59_9POAL|nr:unnamed protein product [Miscanthus lutarioriparius]
MCGNEASGGIKRFKQHLAGGYGDIVLCPKVTIEIRKEMEAYLQKKRRRPLFLDGIEEEDGEDEVVEVAAANVQAGADGGAKPAAKPSSGTAAKRRHAIYQFKASRPCNGNSTPKTTKSVVVMLRRTPEQIVDQRRAKDFRPTIESSTKTKEEKQYVDLQWALWFMECGVSFNAANSRQFEIACEATNFNMVQIEDIGKDNVVQVVTDNGANYKVTGKILMDRIPKLFLESLSLHYCLDLMLEEIGNLKAFKKPIARARHVTTFIYRHGRLLSAMRAQTVGNDLSLYKNKDALKSLFVSEAWIGNTCVQLQQMHTKKRNRLLHKRLNDIVFVSYNRKMRTRFQLMREKAGKKYDPLVIEEFDWDNEWADSLHVPIPVLEGLILSMSSHGKDVLMKPPVHHKQCRVVIFLGELLLLNIIVIQEMFLFTALALKMEKRKMKLKTHMMMRNFLQGVGCYMGEELLERKEWNMGSRIGNKRAYNALQYAYGVA